MDNEVSGTTKQSPMSSELSKTKDVVVEMAKELDRLEQKLSPVLSPQPPTPEGCAKEKEVGKSPCEATDTIIAIRVSAKGNLCRLSGIIARVQA